MNSEQAREILLLYRPGTQDGEEPEVASALECVRKDPELASWFQQHCRFQEAMAAGLRGIQPPEGFKEQILSERKAHTTLFPRRKIALGALALAGAVILSVGLLSIKRAPRENNDFANFRTRMIGKVTREYPRMDLETADLQAIHQYLTAHGRGGYELPPGLSKVSGTGCAVLTWHGRTVSMLCFNSGTTKSPTIPNLFLFIADRQSLEKLPTDKSQELADVGRLPTAGWTSGDKVYLLAGVGSADFLKQYYQ